MAARLNGDTKCLYQLTLLPWNKSNEKSAQRDANTARTGCSLDTARPPTRPSARYRQDRLQYTAPL